jgi:hypothetical protein
MPRVKSSGESPRGEERRGEERRGEERVHGGEFCSCSIDRELDKCCHPFDFAQGRLSTASRPGRNDRDAKNAQKARLSGRDDRNKKRRARVKSCAYIRTKGKSTARLAVPRGARLLKEVVVAP